MTDEELLIQFTNYLRANDVISIRRITNRQLRYAKNSKDQNAIHLLCQNVVDDNNPYYPITLLGALRGDGIDINTIDQNGHTALHYACINQNANHSIINGLLRNGANPNLEDSKGNLAAEYLLINGDKNPKKLQYLIENGLDLQLIKQETWNIFMQHVSEEPYQETLQAYKEYRSKPSYYDQYSDYNVYNHIPTPHDMDAHDAAPLRPDQNIWTNIGGPHPIKTKAKQIHSTLIYTLALCLDAGRVMTIQDLPLLPLEDIMAIEPLNPENRRYALKQLRPIFEKSKLPNKDKLISHIDKALADLLIPSINNVQEHSNQILSTHPVFKERYLDILSELCTQTDDSKIHTLHKKLAAHLRKEAIQQKQTDKLETLDYQLSSIINKPQNPENPSSTTQVFDDANLRPKITKYLENPDIANLNRAMPIRNSKKTIYGTPTSEQLSKRIAELSIEPTPTRPVTEQDLFGAAAGGGGDGKRFTGHTERVKSSRSPKTSPQKPSR